MTLRIQNIFRFFGRILNPLFAILTVATVSFLASACSIDTDISTDFSSETDRPTTETDTLPSSNEESASSSFRSTAYCQVNDQGEPQSTDLIQVTRGYSIQGIGGGCIPRPIREVWAVILNHSVIKASDIDGYHPTSRPDCFECSDPERTFFVFDIESVVQRWFITLRWTTRWYHTVTLGTYQSPNQISINFQKVSGTSFIEEDQESYVLDRVTPEVTSFVMKQKIRAKQVDAKRVRSNLTEILLKMRTGAPDWSALPNTPPVLRSAVNLTRL